MTDEIRDVLADINAAERLALKATNDLPKDSPIAGLLNASLSRLDTVRQIMLKLLNRKSTA